MRTVIILVLIIFAASLKLSHEISPVIHDDNIMTGSYYKIGQAMIDATKNAFSYAVARGDKLVFFGCNYLACTISISGESFRAYNF